MTTPPEPQATNPPNAQPPHVTPEPQRPPVIVQPQAPDTGLADSVRTMANQLAGLPEQIVNSFREATQPAQQPQPDQPSQAATNQSGSGAQPPGSSAPPPPASATQQVTGGTGAKSGSRFADWWFKR